MEAARLFVSIRKRKKRKKRKRVIAALTREILLDEVMRGQKESRLKNGRP